MGLCPFTRSFYGRSFIHMGCYLMDPVLLIGRYPYSQWVLGARPGGIESYRLLSQLGVLPCDRGRVGGVLWLLRFVTALSVHTKTEFCVYTRASLRLRMATMPPKSCALTGSQNAKAILRASKDRTTNMQGVFLQGL